jgi:hypothetical protein
MPDPILFLLVLLFGATGAWLFVYPQRVMNMFAQARARHKITNWLFFKDPLRVRITGAMYLAAAVALILYRSHSL